MADAKIVCVTGGSGMIGAPLVRNLMAQGYCVRVLSRSLKVVDVDVQIVLGDLLDISTLKVFLDGAQMVFHCAAELHDVSMMWAVNVQGTQNIIDISRELQLDYFCFVSSAGVVGKTTERWVDEGTACAPTNEYERSKLEAERIVLTSGLSAKIVILRPTNVVSENAPGAALSGLTPSWIERIKVFSKGRECAHLVHAEDVARAAVFFSEKTDGSTSCYFVSCDEDDKNTFGAIWALGQLISGGTPSYKVPWSIPVWCMHIVRRIVRGKANRGDVKYSSKKLRAAGFSFNYHVSEFISSAARINKIDLKGSQ